MKIEKDKDPIPEPEIEIVYVKIGTMVLRLQEMSISNGTKGIYMELKTNNDLIFTQTIWEK